MEVEELKAILEAKDGVMEQEEEIIYAEEETEETDQVEEHMEEIVEIIEEIVVVEGEDGEKDEAVVAAKDDGDIDSSQSQESEAVENDVDTHSKRKNNYQKVLTYDAEQDWEEDENDNENENDPLETNEVNNKSAQNSATLPQSRKTPTVNGNKVVSGRTVEVVGKGTKNKSSGEYQKPLKIPRHDDEDDDIDADDDDEDDDNSNPHEIVKNTENDLVYTVLGSKKQNEGSRQLQEEKLANTRYIKMERLEEDTIPVEGTIYYEGDDMGTLYVAHTLNEGEQYQFDADQNIEQEDQQVEHQEQWDGSNEIVMVEQGEEENAQDQIFLHEDEDGQLFFKDENGTMQPVYLTEDGNYAIAGNSSDEQDGQETLRNNQKINDNIQDLEAISNNRQLSPPSSPINNDLDNEDNTVTISLIISEDENGLKRTQVIIPTTDALKCEICQKSFKTQFQLLRHNRLKHAREEDITVRNFPCDLCPKRFPDQNSLAKHRKTHTGDRPFQCLECHQQFPTADSLRRHMIQHNPDSKPLPCIYCGRRFIDKPTLQKHEQSHLAAEQQRSHSCDICHKSFVSASDLSLHKKNHDPDKKFDCEVCGREFNRLNNLQRHMLVHQQVRDKAAQGQNQEILSCDVCGITYKFMSSLTRHMVTSHMNPEKLRQQAEEQRRKRENNYKRYLENRKMYETQHIPTYGKRSYRSAVSSDPDDDLA